MIQKETDTARFYYERKKSHNKHGGVTGNTQKKTCESPKQCSSRDLGGKAVHS